MTAPKTNRRRLQFSLRSLLLVMIVMSCGLSYIAWKKQQGKRQLEAAIATKKLGGQMDWEQASTPLWLRTLLGDDFFCRVTSVSLYGSSITNNSLEHLKGFSQLKYLDLYGAQVTDDGLVQLQELAQLQRLILRRTKITDSGLAHLERLNQLKYLDLTRTQVTGIAFEHFTKMDQLAVLIVDTPVMNSAEAVRFQQRMPGCKIYDQDLNAMVCY